MKISRNLMIASAVFITKATADCWSQKLGYPCCQQPDTKIIYSDADGKWGYENNEWCGIPDGKLCPPHTFDYGGCTLNGGKVTTNIVSGCPTPTCVPEKICPTYSVDSENCTSKGGYISSTTINGCPTPTCVSKKLCIPHTVDGESCTSKGGYISSTTVDGCPTPTCVVNNKKECFSEKLGYPCCQQPDSKVYYIDDDGKWGFENNNWCGIPDGKLCPPHTFDYGSCTLNGGKVTTNIVSGCPTPTCVPEKICPTYSVDSENCTSKGGYISSTTVDGCPTPTCVIRNSCWVNKYNYPCCNKNTELVYVDNDGNSWGLENGEWCGIVFY